MRRQILTAYYFKRFESINREYLADGLMSLYIDHEQREYLGPRVVYKLKLILPQVQICTLDNKTSYCTPSSKDYPITLDWPRVLHC